MNEDELRRIVRQQREMQRRIDDALRGPAEILRQGQGQIEQTMRAVAGPIEELRRHNEQASRALEAIWPTLEQSEQARQLLASLDGPFREFVQSQSVRKRIIDHAVARQDVVAKAVEAVQQQWSGLGLDTEAWNAALRQAAESAAVALDSEEEVAAAPDDPAAAGLFLSRAAGLSRKGRAALVAALIDTANQLLDAARGLRSDVMLGATRLAFALVFLALMLYALDDDR